MGDGWLNECWTLQAMDHHGVNNVRIGS